MDNSEEKNLKKELKAAKRELRLSAKEEKHKAKEAEHEARRPEQIEHEKRRREPVGRKEKKKQEKFQLLLEARRAEKREYEKRKEIAEHLLVLIPANEQWREECFLEGRCIYYKKSSLSPKICEKPVAPGSPLCKKHTKENNTLAIREGAEESFIVIGDSKYKPADLPPLNTDTRSVNRSFKGNTPGGKMKRGWKLAWILTPSIIFALGLLYGVDASYSDHSYRRGITDEDIFSGFEYGFCLAGFYTAILAIVYFSTRGRRKR